MAQSHRVIFSDLEAMSREAAQCFVHAAAEAIAARGRFLAVLSGGRTSQRTYELLASLPYRDEVHWSKVHLFLTDERFVPLTHPDSNFGLIQKLLISPINLPPANQHPFDVEARSLEEAARETEESLREFPRFDLVFLGMGADGHVAGILPGTEAFKEKERLTTFSAKAGGFDRLSLSLPVLNAAEQVIVLVSGGEKAEMVARVLEGKAKDLPAGALNPSSGTLSWFLDEAAASVLKRKG